MTSGNERKFLIQRTIILSLVGLMTYGITVGYINFYHQVSQYTQSVTYRGIQESSKDYNPRLMKRNQHRMSQTQESSSKIKSD